MTRLVSKAAVSTVGSNWIQLFVIDVPTVHHSDDGSGEEEKDNKKETEKKSKAAWEDSDDERVVVSLADNPRLRKLRVTEDENLISGKDYQKRLRRQ
jgi:U3 small nucleolar RNA-associated protein 18